MNGLLNYKYYDVTGELSDDIADSDVLLLLLFLYNSRLVMVRVTLIASVCPLRRLNRELSKGRCHNWVKRSTVHKRGVFDYTP